MIVGLIFLTCQANSEISENKLITVSTGDGIVVERFSGDFEVDRKDDMVIFRNDTEKHTIYIGDGMVSITEEKIEKTS